MSLEEIDIYIYVDIYIPKNRGSECRKEVFGNYLEHIPSLCGWNLGCKRLLYARKFWKSPKSPPSKNSTLLPNFPGQAALLWFLNTKSGREPSLSTSAHQELACPKLLCERGHDHHGLGTQLEVAMKIGLPQNNMVWGWQIQRVIQCQLLLTLNILVPTFTLARRSQPAYRKQAEILTGQCQESSRLVSSHSATCECDSTQK